MKFSGRFADFSLPDILRILIDSKKTGELVIEFEGLKSRVFVNTGKVSHAETPELSGQAAVYEMLNYGSSATFEFLIDATLPQPTIFSDLDTLIQQGIIYIETWKKIQRKYPSLSPNIHVQATDAATQASDHPILLILNTLSAPISLHGLMDHIDQDSLVVAEQLVSLESEGLIQLKEETRTTLRRFFLTLANTLLNEFNSISGLKLKQEMNERLEKLIEEKNWMIELQDGIIVDDKLQSLSLDEQTELYTICLNHLLKLISPIYGDSFLQQVIKKVERIFPDTTQHWVKELKLEL
jgi:hypothetical protein